MKPARLLRVPFLIPFWAAAQVWGRNILVRRGITPTITMIAEELAHVDQWEAMGWTFPFLYVWEWAKGGFRYKNNLFERLAKADAQTFYYRNWAERLLIGEGWSFDGR